MTIPTTLVMWLAAIVPIAVLLILMIALGKSAGTSSACGLLAAVAVGILIYKGSPGLVALESLKGVWNAFPILLIIWTALLLYQVSEEAGAFGVIKTKMNELFPNELIRVLAMGWVFVSFLQGITGFGVPVAVAAPLLVGMGVNPFYAVIISLLGQSWGNTFGTLGAAWDSLAITAGMEAGTAVYMQAAFWTALFLFLWNTAAGVVICWLYGKGKAVKMGLPIVVLMAVIQGGGELLLSQSDTSIACFLPSTVALLLLFAVGRMGKWKERWQIDDSPLIQRTGRSAAKQETANMSLVQAFLPYLILLAVTLIVLMIPAVNDLFGKVKVGFAFPETETGYGFVNEASACYSPWAPLTHASTFLLAASICGYLYYCLKGWLTAAQLKRVLKKATMLSLKPAIAIVALLAMSRIMCGTGQTDVMASGMASVLGKVYLLFVPLVGYVGTFVTGSNLSSNVLFGSFQMSTSQLLGADSAIVLGAQTAGGAIGSAVSPSKILLGTTTVGIQGQEGPLSKKTILMTLPALLLIGAAVLIYCCI